MPGRRSTVAPSVRPPKPKKQKAKRSLNALAIAEEQNPGRSKIRRSRLGESEPRTGKRKRLDDGDEDSKGGSEEDDRKRRRGDQKDRHGKDIEFGSDSSGNEWLVGHVDSDHDSDLDSDEAMGEGEAQIEGFASNGKSSLKRTPPTNPSKRQSAEHEPAEYDLQENGSNDEVSEDGSDDFGNEGVELARILDGEKEEEELPAMKENSGKSLPVSPKGANVSNEESSSEAEDSVLSISDNDDIAGDATKLASLQALVSTMNNQDLEASHTSAPVDAQESTTPSEFGLNSTRKLTVADLVSSVTDPTLKKSLKLLAETDPKASSRRGGIPQKLDVPLPKRQQDRIDRVAAYEKSKQTLNRWIDTVKQNRRAEHLSFPLRDPAAVTAQGSKRLLPTMDSKPLTDLESTVQSILQDSGLAPSNGKTDEAQPQAFEELQTKKMSLQEVQAWRAELRKARELLFREETRAKRIKKIKSKSYRKVHRRERERISQQISGDLENSESDRERNDRRRAEERMGARHRESKWAKGVKDSGRARWDEDARGGVMEMARRGEELRRRIEGKHVGVDGDGDVASQSVSSEDDESGRENDLLGRNVHNQSKDLHQDFANLNSGAKGSNLQRMEFMKKAEAARRSRNDTELMTLRREMDGQDLPSEEEAGEGQGRQVYGPSRGSIKKAEAPRKDQKSELEEWQEPESDDQNEDMIDGDSHEIIVDPKNNAQAASTKNRLSVAGPKSKDLQSSQESRGIEEENPWISATKKAAKKSSRRPLQDESNEGVASKLSSTGRLKEQPQDPKVKPRSVVKQAKIDSRTDEATKPRSALKGARAAASTGQGTKLPDTAPGEDGGNEDDDCHQLPFVLRTDELVQKAFAGDEVVQDFAREKAATMDDEEDKIIDKTLPGWGSWTGEGISKKAQKRNKGRILVKEPGIAKEKRRDAKLERVIINEKRVKKNAKYLASTLPHPFETRQQYERSLRLPVGPEWTTKETFQSATKPRILMKQGIITPMVKPIM